MRARVMWLVILAGMTAGARTAAAQEAGDVGITMGYPASVGVIWHISDAIAIRPDVALSWTSTESTSEVSLFPGLAPVVSTTSSSSVHTSIGLSALFYVKTIERLRLYVAPRAAYLRTTIDLDEDSGLAATFDNTSSGFLAAGTFGAQYGVHERFAIFGEVGVQYSSESTSSSFSTSTNESDLRAAGLRSAVGVTVYF